MSVSKRDRLASRKNDDFVKLYRIERWKRHYIQDDLRADMHKP
jgi:hypothetical protein